MGFLLVTEVGWTEAGLVRLDYPQNWPSAWQELHENEKVALDLNLFEISCANTHRKSYYVHIYICTYI